MKADIQVYASKKEWENGVIDLILSQYQHAVQNTGKYSLVLSGGSTPAPIYAQLAALSTAQINWEKVHIFWGDERCVPPADDDSNYKMADHTLLSHIPIPPENIYRMKGELPPAEGARDYQAQLETFFAGSLPKFDTLLLGLGDDGHTASLFPGTPALDETEKWVVENPHPYSSSWRITLTYPVLNAAHQIIFTVAGEKKAEILAHILNPGSPATYPAQKVRPTSGALTWVLDQPAAKFIHIQE